jgi:hypothetical protein
MQYENCLVMEMGFQYLSTENYVNVLKLLMVIFPAFAVRNGPAEG